MRRTKPAGRAAESVKKTAKTGGDCLLLFFRLFYWGGGMLECLREIEVRGRRLVIVCLHTFGVRLDPK